MLTPIPTRVDDPKDAVLWSVYNKLQQIDENQGTRINFATSIAYNTHVGLSDPVFKFELDPLRQVLNIPVPKTDEPKLKTRNCDELVTEAIMRGDDI